MQRVKIQQKNEFNVAARVSLTTRRGDGSLFHALLGIWQPELKEVVCDDLPSKRKELLHIPAQSCSRLLSKLQGDLSKRS